VAARASVWVRPLQAIGQAYFFKGQFDEATASYCCLFKTIQAFPAHTPFLAACYEQMGRAGRSAGGGAWPLNATDLRNT
jgi:hypothetical protein